MDITITITPPADPPCVSEPLCASLRPLQINASQTGPTAGALPTAKGVPYSLPSLNSLAQRSVSIAADDSGSLIHSAPARMSQDNAESSAPCLAPLQKALVALSQGRCTAEHLPALREEYGNLTALFPHISDALAQATDFQLQEEEWPEAIRQVPELLFRIPLYVRTEQQYVQACVAGKGALQFLLAVPAPLRPSVYRAVCQEDPRLIETLPIAYATEELWTMACLRDGSLLAALPPHLRTEKQYMALCGENPNLYIHLADQDKTVRLSWLVCELNGLVLRYVPADQRTLPLCQIACSGEPMALQHVPLHIRSTCLDLCKAACTSNGFALRDVPAQLLGRETLYLPAVSQTGLALEFVPPAARTRELCKIACTQSGLAFEHVPERLQEEMAPIALNAQYLASWAFRTVPAHIKTAELCQRFCRENICSLESVPDHIDKTPLYQMAADQGSVMSLSLIDPARLTLPLCQQACRFGTFCVADIPEKFICLPFLLHGTGKKNNLELHAVAAKLLPAEQYRLFLCLSALHNTATCLTLLTASEIPEHFKADLVDFICAPEKTLAAQALPTAAALYSSEPPLQEFVVNPFLPELLLTCHKTRGYLPANSSSGQELQAWLRRQIEVLPDHFAAAERCDALPVKEGRYERTGGRTLKVNRAEGAFYYKFQRIGESRQAFAQEGLVHHYRQQQTTGPWTTLKSNLPHDPHFFELDKADWPDCFDAWPECDKPAIMVRGNGSHYINVYRYTAGEQSARYAHQPDHDSADAWQKPQQGILAACHDMGVFAGMGLLLTSTLPAFHDTQSDRRWICLHTAFTDGRHDVLPGTFGAWNSSATEYPDIGYDGLRDVGDFEPFGAVTSYFGKDRSSASLQPQGVGQRLALANTLCENLLGALLLRARLRQTAPDYHYKNEQAVKETAAFVENACHHFLAGITGQSIDSVPADLLRQTMAVDKEDYRQWLDRTAREILYWTAAQPDRKTPEQPACAGSGDGAVHSDCYALHLNKEERLCPTLYPDAPLTPPVGYPLFFHNCNQQLNLGAASQVFPLIALVKGLTKMASGVLAQGS